MPSGGSSYGPRWKKVYDHLAAHPSEFFTVQALLPVIGLKEENAANLQAVRSTFPYVKIEAKKNGFVILNEAGKGYCAARPKADRPAKKVAATVPQGGPAVAEKPSTVKKTAAAKKTGKVQFTPKAATAEFKFQEPVGPTNGTVGEEKANEILDEVLYGEARTLEQRFEALRTAFATLQKKHTALREEHDTLREGHNSLNDFYGSLKSEQDRLVKRVAELEKRRTEERALLDELVTFAEGLDIQLVGGWKNSGKGKHRPE
jgi:hypothetical protein